MMKMMRKKDTSIFFERFLKPASRVFGVVLLCLSALPAAAQSLATASAPMNLDARTTVCQGLRIAAQGPEKLVVGWATADPVRGICYRQRNNYMFWDPVRQVEGNLGAQPRDLNMAYDRQGRLNMVWTALSGKNRRLFYARPAHPDETPQAAPLAPEAAAAEDPGDADFPAIAPDGDGGVVIAWQESREMRFSIRALHMPAAGGVEDLGRVSGQSLSGLTPQVLTTLPAIQVAWYEITEAGTSELRVDEWQPQERRWRPSAAEREAAPFPQNTQLLLGKLPAGLLACWQDVLADGRGAIKLGINVQPPAISGAPPSAITQVLAEPPGQHTRPTFSGSLPGRLTLAWQIFTQGRQEIKIATIQPNGQPPLEARVSPATQQFPAIPDHVTQGNWSAVVWTDDVREGGGGGIYFSQINWPGL